MQYLTGKEIQRALLEMLVVFNDICDREGLRYSLIGGTLLGAVRHKGFIPWDDDVDLGMPRPDYERFISLCKTGRLPEGYSVTTVTGDWQHPVLVKLCNESIGVEVPWQGGNGFLWLDILPIDGLPNDDIELRGRYSSAEKLRRLILFCTADRHQGTTGLKCLFKSFLVPLANLLGLLTWSGKRLDLLGKRTAFGETPWVGAFTWGLYGSGERYQIRGWEKMTRLDFEGLKLPVIGCWDDYLHGIYGDYMQLPPEDQRITHGMKAWKVDIEERK